MTFHREDSFGSRVPVIVRRTAAFTSYRSEGHLVHTSAEKYDSSVCKLAHKRSIGFIEPRFSIYASNCFFQVGSGLWTHHDHRSYLLVMSLLSSFGLLCLSLAIPWLILFPGGVSFASRVELSGLDRVLDESDAVLFGLSSALHCVAAIATNAPFSEHSLLLLAATAVPTFCVLFGTID